MTALSQALDLAQAPRLTGSMRRQPLPLDLVTLIRLAAGCRKTLATATAATKRDPDFLTSAAELYLRQVVCFPGADPHRILGVTARTPRAESRRHMRELVLWLHPDRSPRGGDRALLQRVLDAWQTVSASEPASPAVGPVPSRHRRSATYRPVWISQPLPKAKGRAGLGARLRLALRLALIAAGLVVPGIVSLDLSGLVQELVQDVAQEHPQEHAQVLALGRGAAGRSGMAPQAGSREIASGGQGPAQARIGSG